ncbi:uncharacterized protein LOC125706340 [Brienomyrus brachyistius]|uniref:uncharacterized protein LOC125706340 n=1 Tax=Brienomyrus brachyistius TaxID=42636 RepID=UPI0020B4062C|nr:uncharacterized protein LOC125706340 [Brienomyrus brachyistius]XP_048828961.1 uncharacterized protein LOC125706340 [Brienomyrus brachyistius]
MDGQTFKFDCNRQRTYDRHQPSHDVTTPTPQHNTDVSYLAQAIQNSIAINRLPMPEPAVFNGDPIHFIEWKASFMSLIQRTGISSADKLYYLKKYIRGPAHKCLEGTFYRTDNEAYKDAWNKLNQRYGQPFIFQRAFWEKLSKWPQIRTKDAEGLRTFSDFLNACLQAMPHAKGLDIPSDFKENQKLIQKLPDWVALCCNRRVMVALMEGGKFPSFQDFAKFISIEAVIACNPVTCLHALHSVDSHQEKIIIREPKTNKANVLSTQATVGRDKETSTNDRVWAPCILCQCNKHQLHRCPDLMKMSLEKRRTYVKDNKLSYACLKPGHCAKECCRRHSCEVCRRGHPTSLHDYSYEKNGSRDQPVPDITTATSNVRKLQLLCHLMPPVKNSHIAPP